MHWPQIIWATMVLFGLGLSFARSGRQKIGRHDFTADLIAVTLGAALLYWGGFFDVWVNK